MVKGVLIIFCLCVGFELFEVFYFFSYFLIDLNGLVLEVFIKIIKVCFVLI